MTLVFKRYTGKVRGHSLEEEKDELARTFDDVCGKGPTNSIGWWGSGLVNTCGAVGELPIAAQEWHPSDTRETALSRSRKYR